MTIMSKKRCLRMESRKELLPHDVVERILERLPVKTLLRFKAVSKQWTWTIESRFFQERHLMQRQLFGDPDVLMVSVFPKDYIKPDIESLRTLMLDSSSSVKIPTPWDKENTDYFASYNSCDGLVCLYHHEISGYVVNPSTRWYRPLPLCGLQQLKIRLGHRYYDLKHPCFNVGFGKDKITGTYKPVWLYNSSEIGLDHATTCEVFDFSTNAWRYVTPSCPYRVVAFTDPVYLDGSLHWLTDCQETKIVSLNLHTEAFQVISKTPFAHEHLYEMLMCNLDNRLCVSQQKWPNQVVWSFNSGNKTWSKICSIDLGHVSSSRFGSPHCVLTPLALLDREKKKKKIAVLDRDKKKKLLFYDCMSRRALVTYDLETKKYRVHFSAESIGFPVCYFQSLISI